MFKNLIFWKKRKILNPLDFVSLDIVHRERTLRFNRRNGETVDIKVPKEDKTINFMNGKGVDNVQ